jgi:hypothetical protein
MFDLARASVVSVILFLANGFAATTPNSRITISFQAIHASQSGGIHDRGGRHSTAGERSVGHIRRSVSASGVTPDRGWQTDSGRGGVRREDTEGAPGQRRDMTTGHLSPMRPASGNHLWQSTALAVIVWLTTVSLRRNPSMGRKIVLAAFGFLAMAAPVGFGIVPMGSDAWADFARARALRRPSPIVAILAFKSRTNSSRTSSAL